MLAPAHARVCHSHALIHTGGVSESVEGGARTRTGGINIADLPHDSNSARAFIPSLDDFDQYDPISRKGNGCTSLVKWMYSRGLSILEQFGDHFWTQCVDLSQKDRRNILAKRYSRINELWKRIVAKADAQIPQGASRGSDQMRKIRLEAAASMDIEREVSSQGTEVGLSAWLDREIAAETTMSAAQKYQGSLQQACCASSTPEWKGRMSKAMRDLDAVISTVEKRTIKRIVQGKSKRSKLEAAVLLSVLEPEILNLLGDAPAHRPLLGVDTSGDAGCRKPGRGGGRGSRGRGVRGASGANGGQHTRGPYTRTHVHARASTRALTHIRTHAHTRTHTPLVRFPLPSTITCVNWRVMTRTDWRVMACTDWRVTTCLRVVSFGIFSH